MNKNVYNKGSFETKLKHEREFHDRKYVGKSNAPLHYNLGPTYKIFLQMKQLMGDIHGKRVLEYGCGTGWMTLELVLMGADVESFDISSEAVRRTHELLQRRVGYGTYNIREMPAEKLSYDDNEFDLVVGFAILHHLQLDKAIPEMLRVLKKGGGAYFAEPLGTNPLLNLYRYFTPEYRTRDERPLILSDFFHRYGAMFSSYAHTEFYLTALFPLLMTNVPLVSRIAARCITPLFSLDEKILRRAPAFRKWAWYSILCLKK